jgi:NAD(P)-dependent dehydrogenase (short-subunit alcohol dehydrogenase family)
MEHAVALSLRDRKVVVIGRPSGIAAAIVVSVRAAGGRVVAAGRAERLDIADDDSITAFADRVGPIDHLVTTASARAGGTLAELAREAVRTSLLFAMTNPFLTGVTLRVDGGEPLV